LVNGGRRRQVLPAGLSIGLALLSLTGAFASPEADCQSRFLGAWEYRQRAGDGYDKEGERIELTCGGSFMQGLYFGLEREGEHGLFYTLVEVADLKLGTDGILSFTVLERDLFRERPRNLQEVEQKRGISAGLTRDTLHMQGRLQAGTLILTCTSKGHSCPEDVMLFHKGK
jgi:hypothetical protein